MTVDELTNSAITPCNRTPPCRKTTLGLSYSPVRWNALFNIIIDECCAWIHNNTFLTSTNITSQTSSPSTDSDNTSGNLTIETYVDDIVIISQNNCDN